MISEKSLSLKTYKHNLEIWEEWLNLVKARPVKEATKYTVLYKRYFLENRYLLQSLWQSNVLYRKVIYFWDNNLKKYKLEE